MNRGSSTPPAWSCTAIFASMRPRFMNRGSSLDSIHAQLADALQ